ncbi:glycoprotein hormone alpha-2 [Cheilinus undulatus]|uniref:glycoprotein hormone alpha-2 n=1 Tax=Cheilinus undulatus TaxID=241271 RepID=UPI001BD66520|nr:glycoprotein hormone alpha-2 [Cheilinus undulatus]
MEIQAGFYQTLTCQWTHLHCTLKVALPALRLQAAIQMSLCMTSHFCLLVLPVISLLLFSPIGWSHDGPTPGCHLHPFNVTIRSDRRGTCKGTHLVYACVGYCESSAFPSRYSVLVASNFTHNITSASRCCTISKDAKIKVRLDCPRGRHEEMEILTAKACRCDMCRKSRY